MKDKTNVNKKKSEEFLFKFIRYIPFNDLMSLKEMYEKTSS